MSAFERQVAGEFARRAGPVRPVDAAAIFAAVTATKSPEWRFPSLFSAAKFVVAAAIVALFGGFLLAGVLTQPSDEQVPAVGASTSPTAPVETTLSDSQQADFTERMDEPGRFRPAGSLAQPRVDHTATLLADGRVLVVGGSRDPYDQDVLASAEVWDPATESFTPAGTLANARSGHSATLLSDGRVLIVGDDNRAEIWDPTTQSFAPAGSQEWHQHSAMLLPDRRVLVIGIYGSYGLVMAWHSATESFESVGTFTPSGDGGLTATLLPDGRVLVIGGQRASMVWDPQTASFTTADSLADEPRDYTATLLTDGRVLVVGGTVGSLPRRQAPLVSAAVWDPATGSFVPTVALAESRHEHSATLLPDGRVLLVGGGYEQGTATSAEVWDPVSETYGPAGSLTEPRRRHTATLLADGRVLIIGGYGVEEGASRMALSAEIWDPGARQPASGDEDTAMHPDLLPGVDLVTEEVEPGVYRVLSDGAGHDLVAEPPGALIFAPDGEPVLFTSDRRYTLGVEGDQAWAKVAGREWSRFDAAIDDDGNLTALPFGPSGATAVEAGPDGAIWVAWTSTGPWPRVARIEDGVQTDLSMPDDGTRGRYQGTPANFAVAPDGTAWFGSADPCGGIPPCGGPLPKDTKRLLRFDGERWLAPDVPLDSDAMHFGPLAAGPDGTLWVYAVGDDWDAPHLLRLRDGEWSVFTEADGVPHLVGGHVYVAWLEVDAKGTLWIAFSDGSPTLPPPLGPSAREKPVGLLSFDGSTWRQYLEGHLVNRVEVAADGSAWATSLADCTDVPRGMCGEQRGDGLYVITPEAAAAAE